MKKLILATALFLLFIPVINAFELGSGLMAYYHFNQSGGIQYPDATGQRVNATSGIPIINTTGFSNNSLRFLSALNSDGRFVAVNGINISADAFNRTYSLWFRMNASVAPNVLMAFNKYADNSSANVIEIHLKNGTTLQIEGFGECGLGAAVAGTKNLAPDGLFHNLVWLTNGTNHTIYIDGKIDMLLTTAKAITGCELLLGTQDQLRTSGAHDGWIDELAVYNRYLNHSEIVAMNNSGIANNSNIYPFAGQNITIAPTGAFECFTNSFSIPNSSAFELDAQTSFLNVTFNNTNVTDIDVSLFINGQNVSTNITSSSTPNGTGLNNTLFGATYITPIIATNATNITGNWTIICYLNNGSIVQSNTTPNIGQIIGFAHTVQNISLFNPAREAIGTNYSLNLTLFNSIIQANATFFYNNTEQRNATLLVTSTVNIANVSYNLSFYNITRFAPNLVINNDTAQPLFYQLLILYANGSTKLINTSTQNQSVIYNFVVGPTLSNPSSVIETLISNITSNISVIDTTDLMATITGILEWNNTNTTNASGTNISNEYTFGHFRFADFVAGTTQATYNVSVKPFFNITVNQQSLIRNGTNLSRTIHRMAVTQCGVYSTNQTLNYSVLDQDTGLSVGTSSLIQTYLVWLTNQSSNRSYAFSTSGITHAACINPNFVDLNTQRSLEYSATGYTTRISAFGPFLTNNITQFIDLFLLNASSSSSTQVIITVLDQDDDAQQNKLVTIERVINLTNFTLIDSGLTDFQGQIAFTLDLDLDYRINISDGGTLMTLTSGGPASVGPFQILSSTLTFRVLTQSGSSLLPLVQTVSLAHTLIFSNSTKTFTLNFSDPSNYASNICLQVKHYNLSGETLLGENCSTLATDTINFGIGPLNGSFTAFAIATSNLDALRYVFDTLSINVVEGFIFDNEGYAASILITGTAGIMGAVVTGGNPVGLMLGSLIGLGLSAVLGLISLGWATLLGLAIIGGLLVYFLKT